VEEGAILCTHRRRVLTIKTYECNDSRKICATLTDDLRQHSCFKGRERMKANDSGH
jgi:hypothetical protein